MYISIVSFKAIKRLAKKNPTAVTILQVSLLGSKEKKELPIWLKDFVDVFSNEISDTLPPKRLGVDFKIRFLLGKSQCDLKKTV